MKLTTVTAVLLIIVPIAFNLCPCFTSIDGLTMLRGFGAQSS
jgi:hypothetical protein